MDQTPTEPPLAAPGPPAEMPLAPPVVPPGIVCRACDYSLAGLFADGHCPECGAPIQISIRGDALVLAEPAWLHRLANGSLTVLITTLLWAGLAFFGRPAIAIFMPPSVARPARLVLDTFIILCSVAFLVGVWWITTPEHERRPGSRRIPYLTRGLMLAGVTLALFQRLSGAPATLGPVTVMPILHLLISSGGWAALMFHISALARRADAASTSNTAWLAAWFLASAVGIAFLLFLLSLFMQSTGMASAPGGLLIGIFGCWGFVAVPFAWLCAVIVVAQFGHRLEAVQRRSRVIRAHTFNPDAA